MREPYFKWRWFIAPGCYLYAISAPSLFHRVIQRVFLGFRWEEVNDETTAKLLIDETRAHG